jgi:hypothetical protein
MSAGFTAIAERLREKTNFFKRIKLFLAVQSHTQKYFTSPVGQIISTNSRHPVPQEGRIAIVRKRGAGCGGRGSVLRAMGSQGGFSGIRERSTARGRETIAAYGEVVWS